MAFVFACTEGGAAGVPLAAAARAAAGAGDAFEVVARAIAAAARRRRPARFSGSMGGGRKGGHGALGRSVPFGRGPRVRVRRTCSARTADGRAVPTASAAPAVARESGSPCQRPGNRFRRRWYGRLEPSGARHLRERADRGRSSGNPEHERRRGGDSGGTSHRTAGARHQSRGDGRSVRTSAAIIAWHREQDAACASTAARSACDSVPSNQPATRAASRHSVPRLPRCPRSGCRAAACRIHWS